MATPPTTAPSGESSPPRIMAGNAESAMRPRPGCNPAPVANVVPARAATIPAMPQARRWTMPALTPWASAASWSAAVARITSPYRLKRKNPRNPSSTAAVNPVPHRSRWAIVMSPHSATLPDHGSSKVRLVGPQIAVTTLSITNRIPMVTMITVKGCSPMKWRSTSHSRPTPIRKPATMDRPRAT